MNLPIRIQFYQQSKSNVTLPGEEKWADKWDVCVTCDSPESAKRLKETLFAEMEIAAHAKKLALALECLLLSCEETSVVSKWWASAHMALGEYQDDVDRLYPQDHVSPLGKD